MRIVPSLKEAGALLMDGHVVAIPTDTVYGVAASLRWPAAVANLFTAKGRRSDVPLPILVADNTQLEALVGPVAAPERCLFSLWPGPLTIVISCDAALASLLGSRDTVGVRCPDDPTVQALLALTGPLAVTSANLSGEPPATSPDEVVAMLGATQIVTAVLDGGVRDGQPSTVVAISDGHAEILRDGPVARSTIEDMLNRN